jgi:hypothetical protein
LASISGGKAFSLSNGPPGTWCIRKNVMNDTTNKTKNIHKTRLIMNRPIFLPPFVLYFLGALLYRKGGAA